MLSYACHSNDQNSAWYENNVSIPEFRFTRREIKCTETDAATCIQNLSERDLGKLPTFACSVAHRIGHASIYL